MSSDQVRFPAPAVHQHAASVEGIADSVRTARSAVHEVSMDTQAYGQLCQFLPGLLSPIFSLAVDALGDADGALRETAENLRAVAAGFAATDDSAARAIQAAAGPLLELPL
ncbi:type VII secretion target [Actinoplanes sp. NPDC048796]|uniref:type VII secretion target n=1 Tax=unclassified Actinoplanes TaxID=2626549 RepID=UPI0033D456FD